MIDQAERLLMLVMLHWFQNIASLSGASYGFHADWMGNLSLQLQNIKLTHLAIPGSHDSGSYSLQPEHINLLDKDKFTRYFQMALNGSKKSSMGNLIYRWSKTQDLNITSQLNLGVRYLDLRIAVDASKNCYIVHRLVGTSLDSILTQVKRFLLKHPKEIILLDFNHVYFDPSISKQAAQDTIMKSVVMTLDSRLCPCTATSRYTLKAFWDLNCQILVFFAGFVERRGYKVCPEDFITSPFQENMFTQKSTWLRFLNTNYKREKHNDAFYVTQGIMQPHWMEVAMAGISEQASLKNWVSDEASNEMIKWLTSKQKNDLNIVIVDFVENHKFVETVLSLNNMKTNSNVIHGAMSWLINVTSVILIWTIIDTIILAL
ncbi:PI-PLC X domain-containing protein 3-like [Hydractinia symbiolongicarpus]|uniref:PI-PLC X domain-containing protein 3-like n=1 Tax=Hydractinia symbiolongicarpus TaxID=13093 RepID=UPI00254AF63E|nr:PI-PLC X domain-containing protein 3-like [Hydractinia symbiolongicarpus]